MSNSGFFEKKGDVDTLKSKLQDAITRKDSKLCHATIKKTIQLMTLGIDVSSICPEIIKACDTNDIVQKKLVYLYLCSCAESNSEIVLLATNTLIKDAVSDDNSMIRGLALRCMLNMRIHSLLEYARTPLQYGLKDKSSYVRRNAVMSSLKLFKLAPEMFEEMELLPTLHTMIRDIDGQVSYNALVAVNEVELCKGGIKLHAELVKYLLNRLGTYNEFSQCVVLQMIANYKTNNEDEVLEYLNDLDERLKHSNKAVVMAAISLFLHFTKDMDWIKNDVYERIRTPMLMMISSSIPEIVYPLLSHVAVLITLKPRLFHKDYKYFFLRNNDPTYVRQKKLEILTQVITEGNLQNIVDEIREYVHDPDMSMSCKAIYSIGKIALDYHFAKATCVQTLIDILHLEVDYITAKCLQILQELMIKYTSVSSYVLPEINDCWEQVQYHAVGKSAIIWIYGEYGEDIPAAPYHLEELIDNISEEQSSAVKLHLLTAMMKLFFKRPPECQLTLGRLLKYCIDDEANMDVRDRALFYYRLVTMKTDEAQAVFQSKYASIPFPEVRQKTMMSSEDFHLTEFNSLSIIYDQPSSSFITQKYFDIDDELVEPATEAIPVESVVTHKADKTVAVAILLDMNEEKGFCLVKNFTMEKNEFQSNWKSMEYRLNFEDTFTVLPEHNEIITVMESKDIQLMASSRLEDPFWRFLFYAKVDGDGGEILLVEMKVFHQENRMTVLAKCTDENILGTFNDFYRNIFIGKWIALPDEGNNS